MIRRTKIRSNGITFFYEQVQSAGTITAALFFKAGILWEKPREYGITNFVARLLLSRLKNTAPSLSFSLRCGRDHVAFLCTAPPDRAADAVAALARLFDAPPFDPALTERTRADALREIEEAPLTKEDLDERLYFGQICYHIPPAGREETVAALTAEQLDRWREARFSPSNACFVLTGGFSDAQRKEIEAFLREQPARKRTIPIARPVLPEDQFFRTSASDRLLPADGDLAAVTLLFDVDLCETKPVYAELLRLLLTDPKAGAVSTALAKRGLSDDVSGQLSLYTGFAALNVSYTVPSARIAESIGLTAKAVAMCKDRLSEETAEPFFDRFRENRLYRRGCTADTAYDIGLHNYILYTDDIMLPDNCSTDTVMERLLDAADHVLIPDNAQFLLYYNEKKSEGRHAVRQSLAKARIRLFV